MLFERIYDEDLAQASYFLGCQRTGEAVVVDARRDIAEYLQLAAKNQMRIVAVTETHIHADYLSGTRELADRTGAAIHVSGEGGPDWQYGFDAERLHDGDTLQIGRITVQARHTPGHTPEHLVFAVTDGAFADEPGYLLSGDFVFAGELGRPDLLDEAAGGLDTRFDAARELYTSLREVFLTLPDHVQVYPAHGAGSACGKSLGALPSTTVGYERRNAWWARHLEHQDEQAFVEELLSGQPEAHSYFARMKRQNREGPALLGERPAIAELSPEQVANDLDRDAITVVDTRPRTQPPAATVDRALVIPDGPKTVTHAAWAYDPEHDDRPLVLISPDQPSAQAYADRLLRVGIDATTGFVSSPEGLPTSVPATITPQELAERQDVAILDVRHRNEYEQGHLPGAQQLSAARALWHTDELPTEATIVTYCQSGARNAVASSALRRAGFDVVELEGSYLGWDHWQREQTGSTVATGGTR